MKSWSLGPWFASLALGAMLVPMTGCLEGNMSRGGYDVLQPTSDSTQSKPQVTLGTDLLEQRGVQGFYYPFSTSLSLINQKTDETRKLLAVYPRVVEVGTEAELAAALFVAKGSAPANIVLKKSVVLEHDLILSGDVAITAPEGAGYNLRVMPGVNLIVQDNQKPADQIGVLPACSSSKWQTLAAASSLRLAVMLDGSLNVTASTFFHLIVAADPERSAQITINSTSSAPVFIAIDPSVSNVAVDANPGMTWIAHSSRSFVWSNDPAKVRPEKELVFVRDGDNYSPNYCQNLRSGVSLSYYDYLQIKSSCYSGLWSELANSFATCEGVK